MIACPRCGLQVTDLHAVEGPLMQKLNELGESPPSQTCMPCLGELRKQAASGQGGILLAQEKAKEQHRLNLWKNRVSLVKNGRNLMSQKKFSEAAMAYEKYIKILELVFGVEKGQSLTPDHFKETARTEELTVVTSVYWDLVRIYDTSEKYGERQSIAAKQLALFARFTPIFPDILKRTESFARQAKNPAVFRGLLKSISNERPRCFIASAAFESPLAPEVQILRHYRETRLRPSLLGKRFIRIYYRHSPRIAAFLDRRPGLKPFVRGALRLLIKCVS
ncbi:MAG: CFI-box-CTERM domain-containing protein [Bdellovibrionales bacterium]